MLTLIYSLSPNKIRGASLREGGRTARTDSSVKLHECMNSGIPILRTI